MFRCLIIVSVFSIAATAQGIQVTGGGSTLFDAEGAEIKMNFAQSTTAIAGGVINDHVYGGLAETVNTHGLKIAVGDVALPFSLPTDFVPNAIVFPAMGVSISKGDDKSETRWTAFAGETASTYMTPFFFGDKAATETAAFFYRRQLTPTLTFDSAEVVSSLQTAIETLSFHPVAALTFAAAGGLGSNSPFAAGRVGWKDSHWTAILNYTKRGSNFQRIVIPNSTVTENTGLDASVGFHSTHFSASADHTNFESDLATRVISSTVNSVTGSGSLSVLNANVSTFFGTSAGLPVSGQTAGVGVNAGPITVHADTYLSPVSSSNIVTVAEKLSRHFTVNEFIQQHSVNVGGEFRNNRMTLSGGYAMSYFPVLDSFEKVLSIQLTIQLPHAMTLTGGTVTTPDGKTRWTAYANQYAQGPLGDVAPGHSTPSSETVGKFTFTGTAVDADGNPVAGVAVMLGKNEVFTDSHGRFQMPSRKKKARALKIVPEDFMAAGQWRVISAPETASPDSPVAIVVARVIPQPQHDSKGD
jgi:hypothetical protein